MNNNYSAPLTRAGNRFIDWKTSTDPPHSRRWRVRPLLYSMAALFVVAASTTVASQTETQHGSKLVGTGTNGPSEQSDKNLTGAECYLRGHRIYVPSGLDYPREAWASWGISCSNPKE